MSAHTYHADFGAGITCTATFHTPERGKAAVQNMEWSRKPTKTEYLALAGQYRDWINGVREELATRWNIKMMAALNVENERTELWVFEPNKPAQLVEVVRCNIP